MEFTLENYPGNWIKYYDTQCLQVGEQNYTHSLIITLDKIIEQPHIKSLTDITSETIDLIQNLNPEIILIGCEQGLQNALKQPLNGEVMKIGAACRTFNILASEARRVVGLFIFQDE